MNTPQDGGRAFPQTEVLMNSFRPDIKIPQVTGGMSLRDWFAGMALQGLLASGHFTRPCSDDLNRTVTACTVAQLDRNNADEDRPSVTFLTETKSCRKEMYDEGWLDDEPQRGKTTIDCVEESYRVADAMLAARNQDQQTQP